MHYSFLPFFLFSFLIAQFIRVFRSGQNIRSLIFLFNFLLQKVSEHKNRGDTDTFDNLIKDNVILESRAN